MSEYSILLCPEEFAFVGHDRGFDRVVARQLDSLEPTKMTPKQARAYLKWFVSQIPERMDLLREYVESETEGMLDYSPESLISLWEWFEGKIELEMCTDEEIEQRILSHPIHIRDWFIEELVAGKLFTFTNFSNKSLSLALDIAMYYGEAIIKQFPAVKWGCKTTSKMDVDCNIPIIGMFPKPRGRGPCRNLYRSVCVYMEKSARPDEDAYGKQGPYKYRIYDSYNNLCDKISTIWYPMCGIAVPGTSVSKECKHFFEETKETETDA